MNKMENDFTALKEIIESVCEEYGLEYFTACFLKGMGGRITIEKEEGEFIYY